MTGRRVSPLSAAECARVTAAIGRAERGTSGEIVVLVSARAGLYRSAGLALALLVALAVPWPLILATDLSAAEIALAQAGFVLAVLALSSAERLRPFLVPRRIRRARAHEAARREFHAHGLTRTRARTGVLIYVSLAERYAEIVADAGVRARVPEETWRGAVAALLAQAARGDLAAGLVAAVERVGAVLAAELPGDTAGDEIPNRVILLD
ncbi:TPM domain-containing protein [Methylobacterium organophilum]|uniref:TPM domain-containing protein n=1 Tax=Methylobacterium organophilum TaxID=410 RepID=A0ABQ4TE71_METOR|nr:TPM domain-containing protein [Methylobacterium organophilum]GJE28716.1 hypothetical protein LKMONMHP_3589 [Methylobacterium organophilum]